MSLDDVAFDRVRLAVTAGKNDGNSNGEIGLGLSLGFLMETVVENCIHLELDFYAVSVGLYFGVSAVNEPVILMSDILFCTHPHTR